jgi:hypothetical protein
METEPAWRDRRPGSAGPGADPMQVLDPIGKGTDGPETLKIVSLGRTISFHLRDEKGLCRDETAYRHHVYGASVPLTSFGGGFSSDLV